MKQLFLRSLKRQEADNCIRFNTKNYSGTEKRRQMTLPGERLHISRQKVPRNQNGSWKCWLRNLPFSQWLLLWRGSASFWDPQESIRSCPLWIVSPDVHAQSVLLTPLEGLSGNPTAAVCRPEMASALATRAHPNPKHGVLCLSGWNLHF